jgi:subtilisin family serine protease
VKGGIMGKLTWGLVLWSAAAMGLEKPMAVIRMTKGTAGTPITFGLTEQQAKDLFRVSKGKADLRNLYLVPDRDLQALDWRTAHLEGWMDNAPVPPPGFQGTADPNVTSEWWHQKLELAKAWQQATGKGVTLADCDAGYYVSEPDLSPNLLLDHRYDLSDKQGPFRVDDGNYTGHGTSVAAIAAGAMDGKGTNGIAFDSKLVPLQNYNYSADDDLDKEEATARCILRALTIQNVQVILLENQTAQGSSETFVGTRAAVRLALAAGVTVVSAAGNYSKEITIEYGDDSGSILVGAVNPTGEKSDFSNFGKRLSVAAYGRDVNTLSGPNGSMASFGGTSSATPQVAATVALMLEVNPKLTPAQIRGILEKTRMTTPQNEEVGGMLNVVGALDEAKKTRADSGGFNRARAVRRQVMKILSKA